ncbi:MAG: hypothetical protein J5658_04005 [Prevotella sp.]|nr:hypothetical protein [Prevotella sp.]
MAIQIVKWNIEEETGYKPITTFWQDFSIADKFGLPAIRDTFDRAFAEWKGNYKYLTELVMVLNHKIWQFYNMSKKAQEEGNETLAKKYESFSRLYDELWRRADGYACYYLKGEEAVYYFNVTD